MGTERKHLNIPGEDKFFGKGVSYCATCDAPLFKEKTVCVIGGSDAACVEALLLAEHASRVYIIYRKEKLRCEPINTERIEKNHKIEVIYNTNVTEILGNQFVEKIKTDTGKEISLQGVFVEVGSMPNTHLINSLGIQADENGYIKTDSEQRTNIPRVYAAGDITTTKLRQIITACAQGAIAALSAYNDLKKQ
jgi:thioredoxin reductase (NADPH)